MTPRPRQRTAVSRMGIRTRLAVLVIGGTLAVMAVAGALLIRGQADEAFDSQKRQAAALLETLSVPCAQALATREVERLDGYLADVSRAGAEHLHLLRVAIVDHEGLIVSGYQDGQIFADLPDDEGAFLEEAVSAEHGRWHRIRNRGGSSKLLVSMPAVSGLRWGTLVASIDLHDVERRTALTRWLLIALAVVFAITIAITIYVGLSIIVVRPIRRLAAAAAAIQGGDLSARAQADEGGELGRTAEAFNAMAAELQSYTQSLERKVEERSTELHKAMAELERLATTDALTGIHNRRSFDSRLDFEIRRGKRSGHKLGLLMIDVDHFKRLNDTYGHGCGDEVLRDLAQLMLSHLRSTDIVARYGGEEFVVLLLDTNRASGIGTAEKLRAAISAHPFVPAGVTVSIGIASFPDDAENAESLIARADQALYRAKEGGRDQVVAWGSPL